MNQPGSTRIKITDLKLKLEHQAYMAEQSARDSRTGFPISIVFWGAMVYMLIRTFPLVSPIILAFLLVVLLSLALNPVISALRRILGGRTVATLLVFTIFVVIAALTGWAFYTPVKKSTEKVFRNLPEYWERIQKPLVKLEHQAAVSEQRVKEKVSSEAAREEAVTAAPEIAVTNAVPTPAATPQGGIVRSGLSDLLGGVAHGFQTVAANAATLAVTCVTIFVGVVFTLLNPKPVIGFFFSLVPAQHHERAVTIGRRIAQMVPRWALATVLGMAIIGVLVFLAMWPILGLQDAVVLGLIAFVFEAVPYVGPILAVVPAVLLAVGKGGWSPAWVLAAYATIQAIENNLISPVIVAGRLRLHPLAAIFSILVCASAFGVLGVILAVPMVAIVNILHDELYRPRFLPGVSDEALERMAEVTLDTKGSRPRANKKVFRFRRKAPRPVANGDGL